MIVFVIVLRNFNVIISNGKHAFPNVNNLDDDSLVIVICTFTSVRFFTICPKNNTQNTRLQLPITSFKTWVLKKNTKQYSNH